MKWGVLDRWAEAIAIASRRPPRGAVAMPTPLEVHEASPSLPRSVLATLPARAPGRRRPSRADIAFIDTLNKDPDWIHALFGPDRSAVYPEIHAWLEKMDALQADGEARLAMPTVDLTAVAALVSFPAGPVQDIVAATVHLDVSHNAHDCWTARADELEKLLEIHRLMHLVVARQDHHHENDRQPAWVLELPAPSKPRPAARRRRKATPKNGNGE